MVANLRKKKKKRSKVRNRLNYDFFRREVWESENKLEEKNKLLLKISQK